MTAHQLKMHDKWKGRVCDVPEPSICHLCENRYRTAYKINNARKQQRQHRIKWLHNAKTPLRQLPIQAAEPFCNRVYDAVNFTFTFIYVFLRSFVAVYLRAAFSVCLCAGLFHYFIGVWGAHCEPVAVFIYICFNFPVTAQKITFHMALIKQSMAFWRIQYFMRLRERRTPVNVGRIIRVKCRSGKTKYAPLSTWTWRYNLKSRIALKLATNCQETNSNKYCLTFFYSCSFNAFVYIQTSREYRGSLSSMCDGHLRVSHAFQLAKKASTSK